MNTSILIGIFKNDTVSFLFVQTIKSLDKGDTAHTFLANQVIFLLNTVYKPMSSSMSL